MIEISVKLRVQATEEIAPTLVQTAKLFTKWHFYIFRKEMCPVCHQMKYHLYRHLFLCGRRWGDLHRPEEECRELVDLERQRARRISAVQIYVADIILGIGDSWPIVADSYPVLVYRLQSLPRKYVIYTALIILFLLFYF